MANMADAPMPTPTTYNDTVFNDGIIGCGSDITDKSPARKPKQGPTYSKSDVKFNSHYMFSEDDKPQIFREEIVPPPPPPPPPTHTHTLSTHTHTHTKHTEDK